jgi:hypothetical protein
MLLGLNLNGFDCQDLWDEVEKEKGFKAQLDVRKEIPESTA